MGLIVEKKLKMADCEVQWRVYLKPVLDIRVSWKRDISLLGDLSRKKLHYGFSELYSSPFKAIIFLYFYLRENVVNY